MNVAAKRSKKALSAIPGVTIAVMVYLMINHITACYQKKCNLFNFEHFYMHTGIKILMLTYLEKTFEIFYHNLSFFFKKEN